MTTAFVPLLSTRQAGGCVFGAESEGARQNEYCSEEHVVGKGCKNVHVNDACVRESQGIMQAVRHVLQAACTVSVPAL